jgi:hypothetical protein
MLLTCLSAEDVVSLDRQSRLPPTYLTPEWYMIFDVALVLIIHYYTINSHMNPGLVQ